MYCWFGGFFLTNGMRIVNEILDRRILCEEGLTEISEIVHDILDLQPTHKELYFILS